MQDPVHTVVLKDYVQSQVGTIYILMPQHFCNRALPTHICQLASLFRPTSECFHPTSWISIVLSRQVKGAYLLIHESGEHIYLLCAGDPDGPAAGRKLQRDHHERRCWDEGQPPWVCYALGNDMKRCSLNWNIFFSLFFQSLLKVFKLRFPNLPIITYYMNSNAKTLVSDFERSMSVIIVNR